jgi:ABC-type glycerol-3-phosphate transport system permease component
MAAIDFRDRRKKIVTPGRRTAILVGKIARYAILTVFLLYFIMPVVLVWTSSLRDSTEINVNPLGLPASPKWENLAEAWTRGQFSRYVLNSVLYCVSIVSGVVLISSLAGYALAHINIPGRQYILTVFLLGVMVPFQSIMIPLYYLLRDLGMLQTHLAFIVPAIALGLPFGIFLMRGFFLGLPAEIAHAARIDGANEWTVFWRIMLPLVRGGMFTLVIFQFLHTWNAFLMPLVFVQQDELRPVMLGMMFFFGRFSSDQGMIAAAVTITMMPVVILYLALQRQFIQGITAGAIKS